MSAPLHLVLLPGMDGTGRLFGPFVQACPADWTTQVVAYPPDAVRSYEQLTDDVRAVLPRDRSYVLVGESFSGPIALRLAAEAPVGLTGLVLVGSFARTPAPWASGRLAERVLRVLARIPPPHVALRLLLIGGDGDAALADRVKSTAREVAPAVLAARLRAILELDDTAVAARVRVPTLYLAGSRDRLAGAGARTVLQDAIPAMQVVTLDGPHLLSQTRPAECVQAITEWLGCRRDGGVG